MIERSPGYERRQREWRRRENQKWAKKSGPVKVRQATPEELERYRKKKRPSG